MVKKKKLSIIDKLLIAAIKLEIDGKRPFTAEDLVVNAWKNFHDAFGLSGHLDDKGQRKHPDSNRVFAEIMGSKPIRKKGFLEKVGTKMYQLTESGQGRAKQLLANTNNAGYTELDSSKSGLDRAMAGHIRRLFSSKAFEKYINQRVDEITFYDACAFWGITPRSSAIQLENRIANLKNVIEVVLKDAKGKSLSFEHGGRRSYSSNELNLLIKVHEFLFNGFKPQVDGIMTRKPKHP